jgi:hypothetical protein
VEKDKMELLKKEIEYKVNYDLWDEIYIVQTRYGQEATTAKYKNFQDVISEFKNIRFYNLLNADSLKAAEQLTFQVKIHHTLILIVIIFIIRLGRQEYWPKQNQRNI